MDGKTVMDIKILDFDFAGIKEKAKIMDRDIETLEDRIAEKNATTEVILTPQLTEFLSRYKD